MTDRQKARAISALQSAYIYMLQTEGILRIENQAIFCEVRDTLAELSGYSLEEIQVRHENIARAKNRLLKG